MSQLTCLVIRLINKKGAHKGAFFLSKSKQKTTGVGPVPVSLFSATASGSIPQAIIMVLSLYAAKSNDYRKS